MRTHMGAFGTYMYVLTVEHPQADPHAARALLSDNARPGGLGGRTSVSHQGHCRPDLSAAGTRIHRRCRGHWQPSAARQPPESPSEAASECPSNTHLDNIESPLSNQGFLHAGDFWDGLL